MDFRKTEEASSCLLAEDATRLETDDSCSC